MTNPTDLPPKPTPEQTDRNLTVITVVSLVIWVGAILLVRRCIYG